jgi:hypothetical protein
MTRSLIIRSPRLGILNLLGPHADSAVAEDVKAFGSLFGKPAAAEPGKVPVCDVLLLYCEVERNGNVSGSDSSLSDLLTDSRAKVVVAAWNNAGDAYAAAMKTGNFGHCSLILTVDRRGERFGAFLKKLFMEMFLGTPIATAWEKLAPEVPDGRGGASSPNAIFKPGAAGVAFEM